MTLWISLYDYQLYVIKNECLVRYRGSSSVILPVKTSSRTSTTGYNASQWFSLRALELATSHHKYCGVSIYQDQYNCNQPGSQIRRFHKKNWCSIYINWLNIIGMIPKRIGTVDMTLRDLPCCRISVAWLNWLQTESRCHFPLKNPRHHVIFEGLRPILEGFTRACV